MNLEPFTGASRQLQDFFDEGTKRLLTILCLPLVDGVFATLLVSGAVETFSDIVAVSLTIFAGAGALATLYSESDGVREARSMVLKVMPFLLVGALVVSLVAPVFGQLFHVSRMRTVAALVLLSIGLQLVGVKKAETLSVPAILLTGALLSVRNPGAVGIELTYTLPAVLTALLASAVLYGASGLSRDALNLDTVRRGAGVVLLMLSASQFGLEVPSSLGLFVFGTSLAASHRRIRSSIPSPNYLEVRTD